MSGTVSRDLSGTALSVAPRFDVSDLRSSESSGRSDVVCGEVPRGTGSSYRRMRNVQAVAMFALAVLGVVFVTWRLAAAAAGMGSRYFHCFV